MRPQYEPRQSRRDDGNPLQDIMQLMALSKMFGPEADQEQEMKQLQFQAAQQQLEQAQALNPLQLQHLQAQIAREQAAARQAGPDAQTDRDLRAVQTQAIINNQRIQQELADAQAYQFKQPQLAANVLEPGAVKDFPYNIRPPMSFVPDDQQAAIRSQIEPLLQGFEPGSPQMGARLTGAENAYPEMFADMAKISPEKAAILEQWRVAAAPYEAEYSKLPLEVRQSPFPEVQAILQNPPDLGAYQQAMQMHFAKTRPSKASLSTGDMQSIYAPIPFSPELMLGIGQ